MFLRSARRSIGSPWAFWLGMVGIAVAYIAAMWGVSQLPSERAERANRRLHCESAVKQALSTTNEVVLERSRFLIRELDCDVSASLSARGPEVQHRAGD